MGARFALEQGARVGVTTSRRGTEARWTELARAAGVEINIREVDPGEDVVRARLSDPETGILSEPCSRAIGRWYQDMKIGFEVEVRESDKPGYEPTLRGVMLQEGRAASGGRAEVFTPGSVEWPSEGVVVRHRAPGQVRGSRASGARARRPPDDHRKGYRGHP